MRTTTQTYNAVFEHGAFRVLPPLPMNISEGQPVRIIVEPIETPSEDALELATQVYEGLSDRDIEDIEEIILDRSNFLKDRENV